MKFDGCQFNRNHWNDKQHWAAVSIYYIYIYWVSTHTENTYVTYICYIYRYMWRNLQWMYIRWTKDWNFACIFNLDICSTCKLANNRLLQVHLHSSWGSKDVWWHQHLSLWVTTSCRNSRIIRSLENTLQRLWKSLSFLNIPTTTFSSACIYS